MGHWVCLWITTKLVSLVDDGEKLVRRYRVAIEFHYSLAKDV